MLLPATAVPVERVSVTRNEHVVGGDETILVVEDRDDLRATTERILTAHGYRVLVAPDGPTAIALARDEATGIDLVLSDVILAGGPDGIQTAARLAPIVPGARVLFMSGYAQPVLASRTTFPAGTPLIEKPCSGTTLLTRVRAALDGTDARTGVPGPG